MEKICAYSEKYCQFDACAVATADEDCDENCIYLAEAPEKPIPSGQTVSTWLASQDLANACKTNLDANCTCSKEYQSRARTDPNCEYCTVGKYILPLAIKILAAG
ncbi:MAG: hypothetical protein KAR40_13795 [Candidatus Sabulitectum sp.]|nr:hypothetical protein [Candidatus Sabulitectum sp.]